MIELFRNLVGNLNIDSNLEFTMAAIFFLFMLTVFTNFCELVLDRVTGRRK